MENTLYVYFGDRIFKKFDSIEVISDPAFESLPGCIIFDRLKSPPSLIEDAYIGWSSLIVKVGNGVVSGGFRSEVFDDGLKEFLNFLEDDVIDDISIGYEHSLVKSQKGKCLVFDNKQEQTYKILESSVKFEAISCEDKYAVLLTDDGKVYCTSEDCVGLSLSDHLALQIPIKQVACGKEHVLLLSHAGTIFSFGQGSRGQLGLGDERNIDQPTAVESLEGIEMRTIVAGGWHSAAISNCGDLYTWGWNESGQLGFPSVVLHEDSKPLDEIETICLIPKLLDLGDVEVTQVSCGSRHTAIITSGNCVWTFGCNEYGQLGVSRDTKCRDVPCRIPLPKEFIAQKLKCKFWSTLIIGCFIE